MKIFLTVATLLISTSILGDTWNPSLKKANKIAKRIIEKRDSLYLKELIVEKNLNPDFEFNGKFNNSRANTTLAIYASSSVLQNDDLHSEPESAFYYVLLSKLLKEHGSNPNKVMKNADTFGDETALSVAKHQRIIELLMSNGADYKVEFQDHRGERRHALSVKFPTIVPIYNAKRFQYLVELGAKPMQDEKRCETFTAIDSFYSDSGNDEDVRVIMRDFYMKEFGISKEHYFHCVDLNTPICATVPQICEDAYNELMAE